MSLEKCDAMARIQIRIANAYFAIPLPMQISFYRRLSMLHESIIRLEKKIHDKTFNARNET